MGLKASNYLGFIKWTNMWGRSSIGRALRWHCRGHRFVL